MPQNFFNDPRYQYLGGNMGGGYPGSQNGPPGMGFNFGGAPASVGMMQGRPSLGTSLASSFMNDPQPGMAGGGFGAPNPGMPNLNPVSVPNRGGAPQGGGSLGDRILSGLGNAGGGIMDYFTDPEQGMSRAYLATQGLGAAASLYGTHSQNKRYDEEKRRRDELEEEQRRRYDANAPARAALAGMFTSRIGG